MRAIGINRIIMLLSFVGAFIAGFMSLAKILNVQVPCTAAAECAAVTNHPSAYWFGIPVSHFGFLAYLTLAALAVIRGLRGFNNDRALTYLGWAISGVGMLLSFYLQYVSLTVIQEKCPYCIASAVVMFALFLLHAWLAQVDVKPESPAPADRLMPVGLALALVVALAAGTTFYRGQEARPVLGADPARPQQLEPTVEVLLPDGVNMKGSKDNDVIIVEFADLLCATCQRAYPDVKRVVDASNGKISLAYRHFPLYMHKNHRMALPGAVLAEYAATKGKFWEYIGLAVQIEPTNVTNPAPYLQIIQTLGLSVPEAEQHIKPENLERDPLFNKVANDIDTAQKLGVWQTPTFFLIVKGKPIQAYSYKSLMTELEKPEYKALLTP